MILTTGDHDTLRRHGITEAEILEVIETAVVAVYANTMADVTRRKRTPSSIGCGIRARFLVPSSAPATYVP